jgi:NAD(P)-dependent dehydrogenase (short-subunit alcohol dehydrogenase family)
VRIKDQVVLVTGGAAGLGRATALRLAQAGARVVVVDLPGTADHAVDDAAENMRFVAADVASADEIGEAFRVADEWGELRAVVHAAGVAFPVSVFGEDTKDALDGFRRIVEVNLTGTFNVVQHAARSMARLAVTDGDRGVIVTTASIAAYEGTNPAYSATKGGVASFTLPAARQLASLAIRVVSVAPGAFDTALLRGAGAAQVAEEVPHPHRLGHPAEFAALAQHIIENSYINGATLRIDGAARPQPR